MSQLTQCLRESFFEQCFVWAFLFRMMLSVYGTSARRPGRRKYSNPDRRTPTLAPTIDGGRWSHRQVEGLGKISWSLSGPHANRFGCSGVPVSPVSSIVLYAPEPSRDVSRLIESIFSVKVITGSAHCARLSSRGLLRCSAAPSRCTIPLLLLLLPVPTPTPLLAQVPSHCRALHRLSEMLRSF